MHHQLHRTMYGMHAVQLRSTLAVSQKGGDKLGYEAEAFAIYDTMRYIKPPIGTVCVGNAFGEAGMLLAAGEPVRMHKPNKGFSIANCSKYLLCPVVHVEWKRLANARNSPVRFLEAGIPD